MNDSSYLKELSNDLIEYIEDADNEIVYVPILRYASVDGYPEINKIVSLSQNTDTSLGKNLFDSQKIFAIKQSAVDKLKKDGVNLVNFNEWFKKWADKIVNKLIDKVAVYGDIIGYVTGEFNCQDKTFGDGYYYYSCKYSDRKIVYHIFNLFGLDYRKHIQNSDFCDAVDQWMMMEFFSTTIHSDRFDINRFKKEEYYAHISTILNKYGMNGIDT